MNLTHLQAELRQFAADRNWQPFQTPKNLLLRPTEVLSCCVPDAAVLKVAHHALGGLLQHHHVLVRRLA